MSGTIECAFIARIAQDPELRTHSSQQALGPARPVRGQWGRDAMGGCVANFGEIAEQLCATIHKGDELYVEGTLRLNEWTGLEGKSAQVFRCLLGRQRNFGAIVRNKPAGARRRV